MPLNKFGDEELTKQWTVLNKTDAAGNYLISDNYFSLSNESTLNYNKETLDRVIEDLIDSKIPHESDLIPDQFPDYEDLNSLDEVKRKKRSLSSGLEMYDMYKPDLCDRVARIGDVVSIIYSGYVGINWGPREKLDPAYDHDKPLEFQIGVGQVISGLEQGTVGMCVGEKRKLLIPPELGYGDRGAGEIVPGGMMLCFNVELLNIEEGPLPVNLFKQMDSDSDNVLSRDKVSNYLQKQVDTSQNTNEEAEKILEDQAKLVDEIFTYEDRD